MTDFLSQMLENDADNNYNGTQNSIGLTRNDNDDFSLSYLDSQSPQNTQFDFMKNTNQNHKNEEPGLETIREEDTIMIAGTEIDFNQNHDFVSNKGVNANSHTNTGAGAKLVKNYSHESNFNAANEKFKKISQEIDEIFEETQRSQSTKKFDKDRERDISAKSNVKLMNNNSNKNIKQNFNLNNNFPNNTNNSLNNNPFMPHQPINMNSMNNINMPTHNNKSGSNFNINFSSHSPNTGFQIKNMNVKTASLNSNNYGGGNSVNMGANPNVVFPNQKAQLISNYNNSLNANSNLNNSNNPKTKVKANINTNNMQNMHNANIPNSSFYIPPNDNNFNPLTTLNNTSSNYELSNSFSLQTDEMIKKTISVFDNIKQNFCNFIENYKNKFIHDADLLKQVLLAETEFIIQEEEKNKIIDIRMETLFREMMNLLNEFQRY
jgi:hypothetical protein